MYHAQTRNRGEERKIQTRNNETNCMNLTNSEGIFFFF
jgi:hypothetical protein